MIQTRTNAGKAKAFDTQCSGLFLFRYAQKLSESQEYAKDGMLVCLFVVQFPDSLHTRLLFYSVSYILRKDALEGSFEKKIRKAPRGLVFPPVLCYYENRKLGNISYENYLLTAVRPALTDLGVTITPSGACRWWE